MDSSSRASEVSGDLGDLLSATGPTSKGQAIDGTIVWVTFHGTLNDVQFCIGKLYILDIWDIGIGSEFMWEGK